MMDVRRHETAAAHVAVIEQAARRIARAFGYGQALAVPERADPDPAEADPAARGDWTGGLLNDTSEERAARMVLDEHGTPPDDLGLPADTLRVVKPGRHVSEGAARSVTGADGKPTTRATAPRYWNPVRGRVLRPGCRMDGDALAALGMLPRVQQAMLLTYAGELRHWPEVARWCMARGHRIEAACAAADRILWTRPDRTLAEHAFRIGMRQADFRALVHLARADLDRLLIVASRQFMVALGGTRKHLPVDFIGRDRQDDHRSLSTLLCRAA